MSVYVVVEGNDWAVGYTVRCRPGDDLAHQWTDERRQRYLLKPQLPYVLSLDETVWPICVRDPDWKELCDGTLHSAVDGDSCDFVDDLWIFKESVLKAGAGLSALFHEDCVLVAALFPSRRSAVHSSMETLRRHYEGAVAMLPRNNNWSHLGFDVVESALGISGLSNTAYTKRDRDTINARFSSAINSFGLAHDLQSAVALAHETTARVPEHAPFIPVSLYALDFQA